MGVVFLCDKVLFRGSTSPSVAFSTDCCPEYQCGFCTCSCPPDIVATIDGIENSTCDTCTSLNGSFVLRFQCASGAGTSPDARKCQWTHTLGSAICGYSKLALVGYASGAIQGWQLHLTSETTCGTPTGVKVIASQFVGITCAPSSQSLFVGGITGCAGTSDATCKLDAAST